MQFQQIIDQLNWDGLSASINEKGYAHVPNILPDDECDVLVSRYNDQVLYRKTINMERYRFGMGEYKYYRYPLPGSIQQLRELIYPKLAIIANNWMRVLNMGETYPATLTELLDVCHTHHQGKPTPLILRYEKGGYNTLHQDLYGEIYFPIQLVLFLNEPGEDYDGGEFVLVEQRPRAQSKAMVLKPRKGDMLMLTTNFRPVKGSKGYYRVNMKHGVSELTSGVRHTVGVIFHDAT